MTALGEVEPILSPSLCGVQIVVIDTQKAEMTVLLWKWSLDQIQPPLYPTLYSRMGVYYQERALVCQFPEDQFNHASLALLLTDEQCCQHRRLWEICYLLFFLSIRCLSYWQPRGNFLSTFLFAPLAFYLMSPLKAFVFMSYCWIVSVCLCVLFHFQFPHPVSEPNKIGVEQL